MNLRYVCRIIEIIFGTTFISPSLSENKKERKNHNEVEYYYNIIILENSSILNFFLEKKIKFIFEDIFKVSLLMEHLKLCITM